MEINTDTKQAATSVATSATTSTPGAVHMDVSSMKAPHQQAFQKTALTDGPMYCSINHQHPSASSLEVDRVSPKRAAGQSHAEHSDETWKQQYVSDSTEDAAAITDETLKKLASRSAGRQWNRKAREIIVARDSHEDTPKASNKTSSSTDSNSTDDALTIQEEKLKKKLSDSHQMNRTARIAARASRENTKPAPSTDSDSSTADAQPIQDEKLKKTARSDSHQKNRAARIAARVSREDTTAPSVSSTQKAAEQDEEDDFEEEDATPGAVRVAGLNSMSSTGGGVPEDHNRATMPEDDRNLTIHHKQYETNQAEESTRMIIEAQLVMEEDTEQVAQKEREQIQEETRQNLLAELGQVAQAELIVMEDDDGSKIPRHRALICFGIMVILFAIVLGGVLGTRDDTSSNIISVALRPSVRPSHMLTVAPLNNSLCEEAHPIVLGDAAIVASLENATEQSVLSCDVLDPSTFQPGLWYKVRGLRQDKPIIARASGGVDLHVFTDCDQTCYTTNAIYGGSSSNTSVAWTAISGVEYLLLITSIAVSSRSSILPEFELYIVDNDFCDNGFGPIIPDAGTIILGGSTSDGATIDADVPICGTALDATAPGVWYTIIGNGGAITVSTCASTGFDSKISVFTGSCGQLMCVDGNDDACGSQSLVAIQSNQDETYHVLVHGFGGASGDFVLQIITEVLLAPAADGGLCASQMIEPDGLPRNVLVADAKQEADLPDARLPSCFSLTENLPPYGLWYSIVGTGNDMSIQVDSPLPSSGMRISVLSGSDDGCSNLSCVLMDCTGLVLGTCDWESTSGQIYYLFITTIDLFEVPFAKFANQPPGIMLTAS